MAFCSVWGRVPKKLTVQRIGRISTGGEERIGVFQAKQVLSKSSHF